MFLEEKVKIAFDNALEALEDSKIAIDNERYKMSINCSYYAVFYAASAMLLKKGITAKKHSGIIQKFGLEYVINDNFDRDIASTLSNLKTIGYLQIMIFKT